MPGMKAHLYRILPLMAAAAYPLHAQNATNFSTAVRSILPPAKAASAAPLQTEEEAPPAPKEEVKLSFTPDAAPVADTSPAAHAQEYKKFCELLKESAEKNLYDFCPSASVVLTATNDEFALQSWMEKAAAEGYAAARQYLADRMMSDVPADKLITNETKAAYAMVRQAAESGYDPAKINVYTCLKFGIGTPKDEQAADKYLMEACKSGTPIPRFKWLQATDRLTEFGDKDRPEVKAELDRGNHHVAYYLADLAPDEATAFEWFRKAAEKGNGEAFFALSAMLSEREPKQSFELLSAAVKLHCGEAMFVLGNVLTEDKGDILEKTGLKHDDVSGRRLIKLAAVTGTPSACFWLGKSYYKGEFGLPKNAERAYKHFSMGSDCGNPACSLSKGIMLMRGLGTKKDVRQALYYINSAAHAGNPEAVLTLAYALYTGSGLPADRAKAMEVLQDAAAQQYPRAYIYMAYITAKGDKKTPADPKLADKYLRKAGLDLSAEDRQKAKELYETLLRDGWVPEP